MGTRDFVFRHDPEIQFLFEQQAALEREQDTSKRAMCARFLKYAAQASAEELQAAKLKRTTAAPSGTTPGLAKVPVDEAVADAALKHFSEVFQLQRVQTRFLFRVSQYCYLTFLSESLKDVPSFDVSALKDEVLDQDPWEKRMICERSDYSRKKELIAYCRIYLEEIDPALWSQIRRACNQQVQSWSRAYRLSKYTDHAGPLYGKTSILFHAKALAGAILALAEYGCFDMEEIMRDLEHAVKSGEPP